MTVKVANSYSHDRSSTVFLKTIGSSATGLVIKDYIRGSVESGVWSSLSLSIHICS